MSDHFIGIMSGTSLDGVDAVLARFDQEQMQILADFTLPYPGAMRNEVLALQARGMDELHRSALLANQLAELYARAVAGVLHKAGLAADQVRAIGCHGQTIRHAPADGYTLQLGNLARLVELTGIDVVGDFRSRDVAAGGEGAPLVPAFHQALFTEPTTPRVIVNIGGISNITLLMPGEPVSGFDCGPGNLLMDAWCQRHLGQPFDRDGTWAASGQPKADLLARLMDEPFFAAPPPKSTGRDLFSLDWLMARLEDFSHYAPADVQATLAAQTASGISQAIARFAPQTREVVLCGGGACNLTLVKLLAEAMPQRPLKDTQALGMPVHQVEAAAFAWLARQLCERRPGNLPEATGARGLRVLGALYPH